VLGEEIHQQGDGEKILQYHPRSNWELRVTTIEETKGLETLKLDDLVEKSNSSNPRVGRK